MPSNRMFCQIDNMPENSASTAISRLELGQLDRTDPMYIPYTQTHPVIPYLEVSLCC